MQPSHKSFQKPARRAFEDGGSPGSLLRGAGIGGAPEPFGSTPATDAVQQTGLRPGAQAALNAFQPIPMPTVGYANGGMLGSLMRLTGLAEDTPERKAYKAAREAEKAAAKATPAPAKKETPAPMGSQSVLDRRMAEAGLANGGKIKGPGTTTSDSIPAQVAQTGEPIKVSTGERIVSAAQDALLQKIAKARGYKSVDHMFEAETGKPVGPTIKGGMRAARMGLAPTGDDEPVFTGAYNALAQSGNDAEDAANAGNYALAGHHVLKGALATGAGVVDGFARGFKRVIDPAANTLKTLVTGDTTPAGYEDPGKATAPAKTVGPTSPAKAATTDQSLSNPTTPAPTAPAPAPVDEFSNAAIAQRNPGGMIKKVGNSYSGSNITGDVSFQGADGKALPGRPGGGFMLSQGMSQDAIKQTLTNPDGSAWSAGDNAIMAANMRDGVDKYRGTSRDPRTASQDKRYAETNKIAQGQLDITQKDHIFKQDQAKQLATTQDVFADPKTPPAQREAARLKLIALGVLKSDSDKFAYAPGGQVMVDGQLVNQPGVIYNVGTGDIKGGGQQGQTGGPAPKVTTQAEFDSLAPGATYTGVDGKTYKK